MTNKKPVVVRADPLPEWAKLFVSNSFYDDVAKDQNFRPENIKHRDAQFEEELRKPIVELAELTDKFLNPPKMAERGPRPRPEVSE